MTSGRTPADQLAGGAGVGDVEHRAARQRRTVAGDHLVARASRWATRWWPTKPLPPVTSALNGRVPVGRCHVGRW